MAMSNANTGAPLPKTPAEAADTAGEQARVGVSVLRTHGLRLLLVFGGLLLPLWGFGALAESLHEGEVFFFDVPLLQAAHAMASTGFDRVFILMSALGYAWGVVPADVLLVLFLTVRRRFREGSFAAIAVLGSLLLNVAAKHSFARMRPALWQSISPAETTYSFPSGHAMGSMTLALVVVLLCWYRRSRWGWSWRWPVAVTAALFVLLVGLARIYLGVHYPSDILAGWTAASAWVVGVYGLVFYGTLRPWQVRAGTVRKA
jgi:membrane-associated phospholipid phosphatase